MISTTGYAAKHSYSRLKPITIEREEPKADEVLIDVLYCGVCHSDIHQVKNEWSNTVYPCMPGHEVVGRVARAPESGKFKVGDIVGVGCMIDSCRSCEPCRDGLEQYCEGPNSWLATYNGPMIPSKKAKTGTNMYGRDNTFGGYSSNLVVHEDFVLKIPDGLSPEAAAPILCAGVTTFSPLRHWQVKAGDRVGVVGLGGLGHMAVKLARALGAEVTVFTTSSEKEEDARKLGASHVAIEKEVQAKQEELAALAGSFDFIISTVPEKHDINAFIALLKREKSLVIVGALEPMAPVDNQAVAFHRRNVSGSLIGSIKETQEVLDFCAQHGIAPEIEIIPIQQINDAMKKVESGEVHFRYVIDMASLENSDDEGSEKTNV
ncbi:NAD(P)-dependent alcohol dehydrogenase [Sphingomonas piscis]|uniref:NAD(P)-dependent alcohol dehydrogenase n=1 Tax=Sphingomonas piscis TaxID=2714943 RepID=A0A6G7YP02_9SPHN|nr:NAD(P)-dependent alcohol dehydrogenase [Sphingomonas piscis]QIK78456.1 NAD(P)-dependent alcohol dehydrogenase [Sphingomonas piscis]